MNRIRAIATRAARPMREATGGTAHSVQHRPTAPARKGSALIIVLGILALLSVFAAIYITVGQGDTRAAAAIEDVQIKRDYQERLADYVASVIADDRFDSVLEPGVINGGSITTQLATREVTDFPYTDYTRRSTPASGQEWRAFSAAGGNGVEFTGNPVLDPRVASDPWLAATTPTYLGNPDPTQPGSRFFSLDYSTRITTPTRPQEQWFWLDNRDWAQITNVAPDGRPVNLHNLRPEAGGFDAPSGFEAVDGRSAMSNNLSLLDLRSDGALRAFDPTTDGVWFRGNNTPTPLIDDLGGTITGEDLYNVPAVWTMNQRYMFMPARQGFFIYDRDGEIADWGSPDFPDYQYADADGDGMFDSRFFEVVDGANLDAITSLIPEAGLARERVFAAVRVMDLSALVNVNVATDQVAAPTTDAPWGLVPSEIDLRRLLTSQDASHEYGLSIASIETDKDRQDPVALYQPYLRDDSPTSITGATGFLGVGPDRNADPLSDDPDFGIPARHPAEIIGQVSYDALRVAIDSGLALDGVRSPAAGTIGFGRAVYRGEDDADYADSEIRLQTDSRFRRPDPSQPLATDTEALEREAGRRRVDYFDMVATRDPFDSVSLSSTSADMLGDDVGGASLFGLGDLAELLTYRGINDPGTTSRLEAVVSGRWDNRLELADAGLLSRNDLIPRFDARRISPLLANRGLELDRFGHADGSAYPRVEYGLNGNRQRRTVDGLIDVTAMALFEVSPRQFITTYNAATTLLPRSGSVGAITGADAAFSLESAFANGGNVNTLFNIYAEGLLPDSGIGASGSTKPAWSGTLANYVTRTSAGDYEPGYDTLFYGHRGPELAIRIAAHLALNTADLADTDTTPSVSTLAVDASELKTLRDLDVANASLDERVSTYWPANNGSVLDLGFFRLAGAESTPGFTGTDTFNSAERRQLVNIYGFEPMPLITEAASLIVYTDAHTTAGGDDDSDRIFENAQAEIDGETSDFGSGVYWENGATWSPGPTVARITINGADGTPATNGDLAMQVLAFQVTNPWDRAITFDPTWDPDEAQRQRYQYYVEYGGRFYLLGDYADRRIDLSLPGSDPLDARDVDSVLQPDQNQKNDGIEAYQAVTLEPGQSRVFYVSAHTNLEELDDHWTDLISAYGPYGALGQPNRDGITEIGPAQEWLRDQLAVLQTTDTGTGNRLLPSRVLPFSPITGELDPAYDPKGPMSFFPLFSTPTSPGTDSASPRDPDWNEVRLWRVMTVSGERDFGAGSGVSGAINGNRIENDMLADRLVEPLETEGAPNAATDVNAFGGRWQPTILDARLPDGLISVDGTVSFQQDLTGSNLIGHQRVGALRSMRNDNTGWTVTRWGSFRRADSDDALSRAGSGRVAGWMLQARRDGREADVADAHGRLANIAYPQDWGSFASPWYSGTTVDADDTFVIRAYDPGEPDFDDDGDGTPDARDLEDPSFWVQVSEDRSLWEYRRSMRDTHQRRADAVVRTLVQHPDLKDGEDPGGGTIPAGDGAAADPLQGPVDRKEDQFIDRSLADSTQTRSTLLERDALADGSASEDEFLRIDYPTGGEVYDPATALAPLARTPQRFDDSNNRIPLFEAPDPTGASTDRRVVARPADLLLALGIGPAHMPDPSRPITDLNYEDDEWLTWSEALAVALGYDDYDLPSEAGYDPADVYALMGYRDPSDTEGSERVLEHVLEDARLALDRYTPFVDLQIETLANAVTLTNSSAPVFTRPNSIADTTRDVRRGGGVPPAMRILSSVQGVAGVRAPQGSRFARMGLPDDDLLPVMGRVNINTAPLQVLRLLPGLAPSYELFDINGDDNVAADEAEWWPNRFTSADLNMPDLSTIDPSENPDAASPLLSYRDRTHVPPRFRSNAPAPTAVGVGSAPYVGLSFPAGPVLADAVSSTDPFYGAFDLGLFSALGAGTGPDVIAEMNGANFLHDDGRQMVTGVQGLRSTPGFASVGEVLAVTAAESSIGVTGPDRDQLFAQAIDYLGRDGEDLLSEGIDGDDAFLTALSLPGETPDEVPDDPDERLAVVNSVLNSITVRSDVYAVWMVIQGYREADVEALRPASGDRPADPLVPSYRGRYLMIVDRSNVIEPGDRPQVLYFGEVPY
ncbi:MAG: hypothetical protein AAF995_02165 [Planctomycetota bacterium]